jgi:hypothetical protein
MAHLVDKEPLVPKRPLMVDLIRTSDLGAFAGKAANVECSIEHSIAPIL